MLTTVNAEGASYRYTSSGLRGELPVAGLYNIIGNEPNYGGFTGEAWVAGTSPGHDGEGKLTG
jgi:hypothetical protein